MALEKKLRKKYQLVRKEYAASLEGAVQDLMNEGWQCVGGVAVTNKYWCQAMERMEEDE